MAETLGSTKRSRNNRDEEEPGLEILDVVGGERAEPLTVDAQRPFRQEPGIEREEPGRDGRRRVDVAVVLADHESVAVEKPDEIRRSCLPSPLPGEHRGVVRAGRPRQDPLDEAGQPHLALRP